MREGPIVTPFLGALQACVSVLLTMSYGAMAERFRLVKESSISDMAGLGVKLFLPALIVVHLGEQLEADIVLNYVPVLIWAALYTSASIGLAHAVSRGLGLPVWVTPACAFNNTTSLPLLLLQSLESVGSLKLIIPEGDSMSGAITRAQSYFLLCAVVSKTIGYAVGPKMLQNGNNQDEGRDAQDTDAEAGQSNNGDYADNDEEASEETSLLPERVQKARRKVTGKFRRVGRWVSSFLPERVKQELMAPFESPFADVAILCTIIGAALGLVPQLHRAFFRPYEEGGIFNAWLTSSVKNIGKLFTTLQIFVVGGKLGASFQRMKASGNSGEIPKKAIVTILLVRLVIWPAISISLIYMLAKRTGLVRYDPILWFSLMMMPAGPPALVISGFAELAKISEAEKMAVAKTLTVCSPGSAPEPGGRADLPIFDLADNSSSNTPSSVAPDRPNLPIPLEPTSFTSAPPPRSSTDGIPSSSRFESGAGSDSTASSIDNPPTSAGTRRRRFSTIDPSAFTGGTGGVSGNFTPSQEQASVQSHNPRAEHPPSPKRRRLANMRPDGISSANGFSQASNGLSVSPSRKTVFAHSSNSQPAHSSSNGESQKNGPSKTSKKSSSYFGHDREEVTRILIQSLYELGYDGAASLLSMESGYQLESPAVGIFRKAVLEGRWAEAEDILIQSFTPDANVREPGFSSGKPATTEKLLLVENAEKNEMLFYLRQQKFLELLEARDLGSALTVLRHELTPLNYDVGRLHALSSLLMCPPEHLRNQAGWEGPISSSRERLLSELSKSISPSVMIPNNRLAILLNHVKQNQINRCLYHNTATPPSLYSDHMCDRNDFPLRTGVELRQHSDEVWYCQFSHDGSKLVTAGRDRHVYIYDTSNFSVYRQLEKHEEGVAHVSWSPDDSKLITCSQDKKARVWSVETGRCLLTINHHRQPVTAAVWAADGESFVTASLDLSSQLCHWSMRGDPLYTWHGGFRVQDCAITPDGRRLIAADVEEKIHVYDFATHEEEYCLPLKSKPTSVTVSRDSRYMLVNLSEGQIQLIDLDTTEVIRRFQGQKQGHFVIRSAFGGAAENFVVSGSEDSRVYIWHKENGTLIETLEGHTSGCVNAISWNPTNPCMFASAGDDYFVRIWTRERDMQRYAPANKGEAVSVNGSARTSALRSTSNF
ncbi:hypothetical protein KXX13_000055 [Aspergillus fumigatus]|nr:hypothetical protein KXX13_000055 [Aspergillus fumigatus]KAH1629361.1 hypothetical protein KXX21_000128 [Aspergillus fumigatus]KAH1670842.1 hypothetical protein KXX15_004829 [Aspergillus fumigatus]KAH1914501.1 hypothetical protein KXW69_006441 [Aspergillus fumigatus]KAH2077380.1 hypothetical protein KXX03_006239 [Aspergillus fumigatus]